MKLNIRQLSSDDYDAHLYKWWTDWGWQPPTKEFLPEDGAGGLIVEDNNTPVCAGFIYVTNSQVAWVDWIISNMGKPIIMPDKKQARKRLKMGCQLNFEVVMIINIMEISR